MNSGDIVSFFDGSSCGKLALSRAGISHGNYLASEIDKYAIQVSKKNYPKISHIGDITQVKSYYLPMNPFIVMAGSPCQGFSFAGKQLNFKDPRSKLFFNFVDHLEKIDPKYFLLENVNMKQEYQDEISRILGVQPIRINSSLVSAQKRDRLYWTNIPDVSQPDDKEIYLADIIEHGQTDQLKSYCIDANYFKGTNLQQYLKKKRRQIIFNYSSSGRGNGRVESRFYESKKAQTLTGAGYSNRSFTGVYNKDGIRKLTPIECERLQTLPDGYTEGVSNTQRYKMLGNGWTVDVVSHILSHIFK